MLSGEVVRRMPVEPPDYPLGYLIPIFQSQDVVFGNLETPLTDRFEMRYHGLYPRFAAPTALAARLANAGLNVVSLANNHILDQGVEGLRDTLNALTKVGIHPVGVVENLSSPQIPVIVIRKGLRLGFLAYSASHTATTTSPGAAPIDMRRIAREVSETRKLADIVIVSLHLGYEYAPVPGLRALSVIRRTLRHGADIVLGHHPHVPQGLVRSGGGVAVCSLGNCVTDMGNPLIKELNLKRAASEGNPFAPRYYQLSTKGVLVEFSIEPKGKISVRAIELFIAEDYAPRPRGEIDLNSFDRPTCGRGLKVELFYQFSRVRVEGMSRVRYILKRLMDRGT